MRKQSMQPFLLLLSVFVIVGLVCFGQVAQASQTKRGTLILKWAGNGPNPENVILIHGFFSNAGIWDKWVEFAKAEKPDATIWTFDYDWGDFAGDAAWNLKETLRRSTFRGKPLVLVGHSKGGFVAKAFAHRLTTTKTDGAERDRNFNDPELLDRISASKLRIYYLDTPHAGATPARFPAAPGVNPGVLQELEVGYGRDFGQRYDPGDQVESYIIVPDEKVTGFDSPGGRIVTYSSGTDTKARETYVIFKPDLEAFHEAQVGGWHSSVARCKAAYDIVFRRLEVTGEREFLLEGPLHHYGDNHFDGPVNVGFVQPSEGLHLLKSIEVPGELVSRSDAWIVVNLRGAQFSVLRVNGRLVGNLENTPQDNGGAQAFPVPMGLLRPGQNVVSIESLVNPQAQQDRDDFECWDLTLFFGDPYKHAKP